MSCSFGRDSIGLMIRKEAPMSHIKATKCDCPAGYEVWVEYQRFDHDHYDGVSEFMCTNCNRRWGRWTGKELFGEEREPRYVRKNTYKKDEDSKI